MWCWQTFCKKSTVLPTSANLVSGLLLHTMSVGWNLTYILTYLRYIVQAFIFALHRGIFHMGKHLWYLCNLLFDVDFVVFFFDHVDCFSFVLLFFVFCFFSLLVLFFCFIVFIIFLLLFWSLFLFVLITWNQCLLLVNSMVSARVFDTEGFCLFVCFLNLFIAIELSDVRQWIYLLA